MADAFTPINYNDPAVQGRLQQIQQSPLLQTLFAPYLSGGIQNTQVQTQTGEVASQTQNIQAGLSGVQAQSQISQANIASAQQKADQVTFLQTTQKHFDAIQKSGGYIDPNTYNTLQAQATSLGIPQETFDSTFGSSYTDPTKQINYNTAQGRDLKNTEQTVVRQINAQLQQYYQIPESQRGLISKADFSDIPILGQILAPDAVGYEASKAGLAGQLKGLVGVNRVTQPELNNWLNLLPNATDTKEVAAKKINELDSSIKATFNTNSGLDPKYTSPNSNGSGNTVTPPQSTQDPRLADLQSKGAFMGEPQRAGAGGGYKDIANILPTMLGIGGAIAGAAVPIGGETGATEIAGGAAGQGAGQFLQNLLQGKPLGQNVPQQTATGLIGGGIGRGLGFLGGVALKNAGQAEVTGGLNFTRAGMNTLNIINKEPVQQTLMRNNLIGADAQKIQEGVAKAQQDFDSVAKNSNVPIDQNSLLNNSITALNGLEKSSVPSQKALADKVSEALNNVFTKVANGSVKVIGDLNNERKDFDNATASSQFGNADWGVNRIVGDVLRKSVQDTADGAGDVGVGPNGESLKDMGSNLNKLYTISKMADKRVGQGNSAGVMSISNMIMAGLGSQALGGGPLGLMLGGGATYAVRRLLASSPVAKILAKGAMGVGKAISNPAVSTSAGIGAGGLFQYLMQQ